MRLSSSNQHDGSTLISRKSRNHEIRRRLAQETRCVSKNQVLVLKPAALQSWQQANPATAAGALSLLKGVDLDGVLGQNYAPPT